jgi:transposase
MVFLNLRLWRIKMIKFKTGESRSQAALFPSTIEDYLPKGHLGKLVVTIVNKLNLENIIKKYSQKGQKAFDPAMLVALLFYGYAIGVRSSRKLSKGCEERVDFMYIAAKLTPSHKSISEFRRENVEELKDLFQQIVLIGIKLGIAKMGNIKVSVDGSKIRANASSKLTKDEEGLNKLLEQVKEQVALILNEAEATDSKEDMENGDMRGDEIPKELHRLEGRKESIEKAIKELKEEKEKMKEDILAREGKIKKRDEKKIEKKKINLTDADAQYMKEREGCIKANYNCQASVDEAVQFILANDVTDECNDKKQLIPMLTQTQENIEGEIDKAKADSGYHSGQNLAEAVQMGVDVYIDDPNRQRVDNENYKYDKVNFIYDPQADTYICPEGKLLELKSEKEDKSIYECTACPLCPAKEVCTKAKTRTIKRDKNEHFIEANREKILSEEGKKEYKKRMHTVEPVFGNLKFNLGFRQFLLRGLKKVKGEFNLMCIAHNIKKIFKYVIENEINLKLCLTS